MSEPKINLSIILKGRVMLSESDAKAQNAYDNFNVEVSDAKGKNKEVITVNVRQMQNIKQSINLTKEAYLWMIDDKSYADAKVKAGQWKAMNAKMRLEAHLRRITEHLGGQGFTYNVLED
jgi:hypothetical protein